MPRKKISTDAEMIEAIPDLEDNEQIVIEDTKRIRREILQTERPKEPEPETVIVEPVEDEDLDPPRYSDTSLAALIFNEDQEQIENQFCSVHVRRNPDSMTDRFLNPCNAVLTLPPLRNIELSAEKSDIEETVRRLHGGGHYFLQLHFNNRLASSWKVSLGDSPEALAAAKAEKFSTENPQPLPPAPAPPVNPFDSFLESLEKQKRMKELLFGDEMKELETLRARAAEPPLPPPQSETLAILEKAMQSSNPTLQDRLLEMAFPSKDEAGSHWIVDLMKTAFEHKEELAGLAQMVLGGLVPKPKPQGIEALLRSQPPATNPPGETAEPSRSNFRRKIAPGPEKEPENEQPDNPVE
jgi:hypothetical protein